VVKVEAGVVVWKEVQRGASRVCREMEILSSGAGEGHGEARRPARPAFPPEEVRLRWVIPALGSRSTISTSARLCRAGKAG
jgi:hypothetical protein